MNLGALDYRARIILKGSGLSRGKTVAISISIYHSHILFHLLNKGLEPVRLISNGRKDDSGSRSVFSWGIVHLCDQMLLFVSWLVSVIFFQLTPVTCSFICSSIYLFALNFKCFKHSKPMERLFLMWAWRGSLFFKK